MVGLGRVEGKSKPRFKSHRSFREKKRGKRSKGFKKTTGATRGVQNNKGEY